MFNTGKLHLKASRWTPFYYEIEMPITLTGATLAMEVRDRKDGGFVRCTLGNVATAAQGLRILSANLMSIQIDEATMEAMDIANDAGALGSDGIGFWDLHITPAAPNDRKFMALQGTFTAVAGVTN
jgi:hypothetical protein